MIGIFYICFMTSGFAAIIVDDYSFIALILYIAFVGVIYLVGCGQLKKITVKIFSITALGFFGVAFIMKMIRLSGKRPYVMAIAFAVICYAAQAAVNISVPIVTPVMLMLLAMGVSGEDEADKEIS